MEASSADRPTSKAGVFVTAFRNRSLLLIEIAWLAFNGAEWGIWLTLSVWAYTHGGAAAVSLIIIVQLVPCILLPRTSAPSPTAPAPAASCSSAC